RRLLNHTTGSSPEDLGQKVPALISALVAGAGCSVFIVDPDDPEQIRLIATDAPFPRKRFGDVYYRRDSAGITPWVYFEELPAVNISDVQASNVILAETEHLRRKLHREVPVSRWSALPATHACESSNPGPLIVVRFTDA